MLLVVLVVHASLFKSLTGREHNMIKKQKRVEAEQGRKDRELPVVFGQKRVKRGAGQLDMAISVHPFLARRAPGAPVFSHCPFFCAGPYFHISITVGLSPT